MNYEALGLITFIALLGFMTFLNSTRIVEVHICELNKLTTYVDKKPPPTELNLGECIIKSMRNERYGQLRRVMRKGAK
jgi:hypothetical protein